MEVNNMVRKHLFLAILALLVLLIPLSAQSETESVTLLYNYSDDVFINTHVDQTTVLNNVVIFIRFSDEVNYQSPYTFEDYDLLYNSLDTVSLRDYYLEVSYGRLDITSHFAHSNSEIVFYTDIHPRNYYQPYDSETNPDGTKESSRTAREHALLKRAIDFVDEQGFIDSSINLDINNDGDIDSITFMVSGDSDEWNSLLWPHQWSLFSYSNDIDAPSINGVYAYDYAFNLIEAYNYETLLGVIAHEMFHVLSAPDLYHYYDYQWLSPVGAWGLMDEVSGIPSHMLGYMKQAYGGWIDDVITISESGTYTLSPVSSDPSGLIRIDTGYSNEFLYLEFRQQYGKYERTLPNEGLLVYRVDFDYAGYGNVYGYYDEDGNPTDEVYLFRPDISLIGPPYNFSSNESWQENGDVDQAALSQFNGWNAVGLGTSIPLFHSDGTVMNITIDNVMITGDTITFDVKLPGQINLVTPMTLDPLSTLYLVDLPGLFYQVTVDNLSADYDAYYTLDGTIPNQSDALVTGPITIFNGQNVVTVAVYKDGVFVENISKTFNFVESIESAHYPYGNDQNISWFIGFGSTVSYELTFSNQTFTEEAYDYIYIDDGFYINAYDGDMLAGQTLEFINSGLLIQFISDEWLDDYYGFSATLSYEILASIDIIGDSSVTVEVGTLYEDLGATYRFESPLSYTMDVFSTVDIHTLGTYTVTYILLDESQNEITRSTRLVTVVDTTKPVLTLNPGIDTLFVGDSFSDSGVVGTDNYDEQLTIVQSGAVNSDVAGTYILTYTAVDSSNNTVQRRRIVTILEVVDLTFNCIAAKTTYSIGSAYKAPLCTFGGRAVVPDASLVDPTRVGTYPIVYRAEYKGVEFTYYTYVFYISNSSNIEAIMPSKKEDTL
jgi:M6 family metalloprotease-like protein